MLDAESLQRLIEEFNRDRACLPMESLLRKWGGSKGLLNQALKSLKNIESDKRRQLGEQLNSIKEFVEELKQEQVRTQKLAKLSVAERDLSYTFNDHGVGRIHPVSELHNRLARFYMAYGFEIVDGPEIETSFNNFDALNIPEHHPARDMQDTFYLSNSRNGDVLRTHTTSIQARVFQSRKPPFKVICFGRVYRNETEDASHQAMFDQFELLWVDRDLGLGHLISLIDKSLRFLFGQDVVVRFVPKYYPYTQPSIGAQIGCSLCKGAGCSMCGGSGYSTVGGAGLVHPYVFKRFGICSDEFTGLAFGLGSSRLAAQGAGLSKLKSLYDADLRYFGG